MEATKYSKQMAKILSKLSKLGLKEEGAALLAVAQKRYAELAAK